MTLDEAKIKAIALLRDQIRDGVKVDTKDGQRLVKLRLPSAKLVREIIISYGISNDYKRLIRHLLPDELADDFFLESLTLQSRAYLVNIAIFALAEPEMVQGLASEAAAAAARKLGWGTTESN